jgi:predicted  nucleic acid-binding Zn-ribbon protein
MTDKELIQKLKGLKSLSAGGNPNQDWVLSNKKILMSQITPATAVESKEEKVDNRVYYFQHFNNIIRQRVFRPAMATLGVVAFILVYTATVSVAGASLPGEMLYPVKAAQEKVQLAFTFSDKDKVRLQMTFVSRRADELQKIVRETGDAQTQKSQIEKTVKKISDEVESVKAGLAKISIASVDSDLLNVAKEIDTKTLEVKEAIVAAQDAVIDEIKAEVSEGIKKAIDDTDDTGTVAIGVIVDEYEKGEDITDDEVVERVTERIKNTEEDIEDVREAISGVSTSTVELIIDVEVIDSNTEDSAKDIETLDEIKDKPQEAQDVIDEAKDLLGKNDFTSALKKITETNILVDGIEDDVESIEDSTTSTSQILEELEDQNSTSVDIGTQSENEEVTVNETTVEVIADEVTSL